MPRQRSPNRRKAFELYKKHKGQITNREIASRLKEDEKVIAVWKSRDKWNVVQQSESCTTNERKKDNKQKRSGNPSPAHKFPEHNSHNLMHGLRSKYLHQEQIEIIEAMNGMDIVEQLWMQIEIKFSAIIRMQKIMWVKDAADEKRSGVGMFTQVAFAHERYESYIKAMSRAMGEYRSLVKQWQAVAGEDKERELKLQGMQLDIDKKQEELKAIRGDDDDENIIDEFNKATAPSPADVETLFGGEDEEV